MKILYLKSDNRESDRLEAFLREDGNEVVSSSEKVSSGFVSELKPEIIISYNHRFILKKDVIAIPRLGVVNLHISYLPWNKGADPNFWSQVEGTPKGVTIHYIDPGIDTGDIISQKEVDFPEGSTLKTSYSKLHEEIQKLFREIWQDIKRGRNSRKKQAGKGTSHLVKDRAPFEYLLKNGWDTPLAELQLGLDHDSIHNA